MKVWWENVTVNKEGNIALLHQTFVHQTTSSKTSSSSATSSNTTAKRRTTAVNRRPPAGDEAIARGFPTTTAATNRSGSRHRENDVST